MLLSLFLLVSWITRHIIFIYYQLNATVLLCSTGGEKICFHDWVTQCASSAALADSVALMTALLQNLQMHCLTFLCNLFSLMLCIWMMFSNPWWLSAWCCKFMILLYVHGRALLKVFSFNRRYASKRKLCSFILCFYPCLWHLTCYFIAKILRSMLT